MTVRKFRWPDGDGFDVLEDGRIFRVNDDGERMHEARGWTVEELEDFAQSPNDILDEVTEAVGGRTFRVHTTKVIFFNGEVISAEEAKRLHSELSDVMKEIHHGD